MKKAGGLVIIVIVALLTIAACSSFSAAPETASPEGGTAADSSAVVITDAGTPAAVDCDGAIFCETFASPLDPAKWTTFPGDKPPTPSNGSLKASLPADGQNDGERIQTTLPTMQPIRVSFDVEVDTADFEGNAVLIGSVGIADEFIGLYANGSTTSPSLFVTLSTNGDPTVGVAGFKFGTGTHVELQIHPGPSGDVTFFVSPPDGSSEQLAGVKTDFSASGAPILTIGPSRPQGETGALTVRYFNVLVRMLP